MAIDMHSHWVPRGLIAASAANRDWYGWRLLRDSGGREYLGLGTKLSQGGSKGQLDDPAARAKARAADGIHLEALILLGALWNYHLDEADAVRFCREVNEEVAAVQAAYPNRFRGMALLPMQHTKAALKEMDRVGALGLRTIATAANVLGANLDEPPILEILEAAAVAGFSICVHPPVWGKAGEERMQRHNFWNSFGSPLELSLAAMSIVYSGLLDRHPDLRIMFTQGGGWIHYGVGRLDLRYRQRRGTKPMEHPPADYLSRMYFDCLVHDDDALALLAKRAGSDRIMVGTDYPASGDIIGGAVHWIENAPLFSVEEKEQILWRNAARFLGLDDHMAAPAKPH